MNKVLVLVESPAKAKTIQKLLVSIDPSHHYLVLASFGHVCDMPQKTLGIDSCTLEITYEVTHDKRAIVKKIKEAANTASIIYLASDADREGESIAWHLSRQLKKHKSKMQRITFQEITLTALKHALSMPRQIDMPLVMAQQGRRAIDRIVGYKVSPLLWNATEFKGIRGLSAGRVQSAALNLIVSKDDERKQKTHELGSWRVYASFKEQDLVTLFTPNTFKNKEAIATFFKACPDAWYVTTAKEHTVYEHPPKPFTTSTLQQAAVKALGWSTKDTMRTAQNLYEAGKITYMRTDSTSLAKEAIAAVTSYIAGIFGEEYCHVARQTQYATQKGAHEAIRPTQIRSIDAEGLSGKEAALYTLIFNHTVQSLMAPAAFFDIDVTVNKDYQGTVRSLLFPGYLRLKKFDEPLINVDMKKINPFHVGQCLNLEELVAKQEVKHPPKPHTEGTIVKAMETKGIGRPSTYASTLDKLLEKSYVQKHDIVVFDGKSQAVDFYMVLKTQGIKEKVRKLDKVCVKNAIVPTDLGRSVVMFLHREIPQIVDCNYTAHMEHLLDNIATCQDTYENVTRSICKELGLSI